MLLLQQKQRKELETLYTHLRDKFGVHIFFWDPRLHASPLLGQQDLGFLWITAIPLLWTFFRPSQPCSVLMFLVTGFVMKTHFVLEMTLFGHRHSQNVKPEVSKSFPSKESAKARVMI